MACSAKWRQALKKFGNRIYDQEADHYEQLSSMQGLDVGPLCDWMFAEPLAGQSHTLFPLGMGVGLLTHSVLGSEDVSVGEDTETLHTLGDAASRSSTLLKDVLDTGLSRDPSAYLDPERPRPKSRRMAGQFSDRRRPQDMRAEYPLGWMTLDIE